MLSFLIASAFAVELPDWTRRDTLERIGTALRVVCVGHGPSLDLAREQANTACKSEAIRQVSTNLVVRSESVESEHDAAFHQQITVNKNYTGVDCAPIKEAIVPGADETTVYLKCSFDLAKIKYTEIVETQPKILIKTASNISEDVPTVENTVEHETKRDSSRLIIISSIPGSCDTVIVRGKSVARVVRCIENPQVITINVKTDKELMIRPKLKGYMPKSIPLNVVPATLEVQFEQE